MKKILIIEDCQEIREVLETFLSSDYQTVSAKDGLEGIKKIENGLNPDLILLDLHMPVMDGFELMKNKNFVEKHIPTLIITADVAPATLSKVDNLPILKKPFSLEDLTSQIEQNLT